MSRGRRLSLGGLLTPSFGSKRVISLDVSVSEPAAAGVKAPPPRQRRMSADPILFPRRPEAIGAPAAGRVVEGFRQRLASAGGANPFLRAVAVPQASPSEGKEAVLTDANAAVPVAAPLIMTSPSAPPEQ